MNSRRRRIGVLLGGDSSERAVSLQTGEAVLAALIERGHDALPLYVDRDVDLALRQEQIEVAFIALHGRGADGPVQGLLESLGIPYTGPSLWTAAMAADKLRSKELLRLHNLPTPTYYCHRRGQGKAREQHGAFGFPCVVKPRSGGSGIGVQRVSEAEDLDSAVEAALRLDDDVIVERWLDGREVQVAVLDGQVLGVAEVVANGSLLDYSTRFVVGRAHVTVPPRLGLERLHGIATLAQRAYRLFACCGVARIDLIVSQQGNESLLEINALPDLGPLSLVPRLAQFGGVDFGDLVDRLVGSARLHAGRRVRERRESVHPWSGAERRAGGMSSH